MAPDEHAVDTYLAAWNEHDLRARRSLLEKALTEDAELTGPTGTFTGYDAIERLIAALRERMGGARIVRSGDLEDGGSFAWQVLAADGTVLLSGRDDTDRAADGRLRSVRVAL
jgi:hypothetical protein